MIQKKYGRYINIFLILLILLIVYLVIEPFLITIITALTLAYIFYPLYKSINKKIKNKSVSSFITSLLILILVALPVILMISNLQTEAVQFYDSARELVDCEDCLITDFENMTTRIDTEKIINDFSNNIINYVTNLVLKLPNLAFRFLITLFIMFYMFRDGKEIATYIFENIRAKKSKKTKMLKKLRTTVDSIIYGNLIIAILQGSLGAFGFYLLGLSSPILYGILMGFFSLIPFIGTAAVWLPASILLFINDFWTKGIILLAYGFIIVGGIDSLIKPIIIGDHAKIHPVIVLVGILGGIPLMGAIGIILGPLILGVALTILSTALKGDLK